MPTTAMPSKKIRDTDAKDTHNRASLALSVIIPTYNERETIAITIASLKKNADSSDIEVVVVDSSPIPLTPDDVPTGTKVMYAKKGRAQQMNAGAAIARSETLLFLHADTFLPQHWDSLINDALQEANGGGFLKKFNDKHPLLVINAWFTNLRARFFKSFQGDNAIFIKKTTFIALKGFRNYPVMEDVDFSRRLRKFGGGSVCLPVHVTTSSRRFRKHGYARTLFIMAKAWVLFLVGLHPEVIKRECLE